MTQCEQLQVPFSIGNQCGVILYTVIDLITDSGNCMFLPQWSESMELRTSPWALNASGGFGLFLYIIQTIVFLKIIYRAYQRCCLPTQPEERDVCQRWVNKRSVLLFIYAYQANQIGDSEVQPRLFLVIPIALLLEPPKLHNSGVRGSHRDPQRQSSIHSPEPHNLTADPANSLNPQIGVAKWSSSES